MRRFVSRREAMVWLGGLVAVGCGSDAGPSAETSPSRSPGPAADASVSGADATLGEPRDAGAPEDAAPEDAEDAALPKTPEELLSRIDAIVVVMMENRSFDHFLGALRSDPNYPAAGGVEGLTGTESNPGPDGGAISAFKMTNFTPEDPPHSWNASHAQWNNGANDGFVKAHSGATQDEVMGYHDRSQLEFYYFLADHFTVCDHWFASVMGPTWPNRFYLHACTSGGKKDNSAYFTGAPTTLWKRLQSAGKTFKNYAAGAVTWYTGAFIGEILNLNPSKPIAEFFTDAKNGTLPNFSIIDPDFFAADDHPSHDIRLGQVFVSSVYRALTESPQWKRTLLVITYDEHGGFFDHVPPPTTEDDHVDLGFDQMGFRIPVVVVGPWVKPGVCNTTFDNTSWLKLVCERFGIEPWTARIAAATSLAEVLDAERMAAGQPYAPAEVPVVDVDDEAVPDECLGGGLGPTAPPASGSRRRGTPVHVQNQEELQAFIRAHMPEHDHTDTVPARMARLRGWLRERQRGARGATGG